MCAFGMTTTTNNGNIGYVFKPTCFITNSRKVFFLLDKQCNGRHTHIPLMNGRAKKAEVYPTDLCEHICKGIREQLDHDLLMQRMPQKLVGSLDSIKPVPAIFSVQWYDYIKQCDHNDEPDAETCFIDDSSGAPLSPQLVTQARGGSTQTKLEGNKMGN